MDKNLYKIGDLAELADISTRTIRYYEELGLISSAQRSTGGFRYFTEDDLNKLKIIKKLQLLNYQLSQIQEILRLRHGYETGREAAPQVAAKLNEQLEDARRKLEEYKNLIDEIVETQKLVTECFNCEKKPDKQNCVSCQVLLSRDRIPLPFEAIL